MATGKARRVYFNPGTNPQPRRVDPTTPAAQPLNRQRRRWLTRELNRVVPQRELTRLGHPTLESYRATLRKELHG